MFILGQFLLYYTMLPTKKIHSLICFLYKEEIDLYFINIFLLCVLFKGLLCALNHEKIMFFMNDDKYECPIEMRLFIWFYSKWLKA